jgi:hypothetical protein
MHKRQILALSAAILAASCWQVPAAVAADAPAWMHAAASAPPGHYDEKTKAVLLYAEDVTTVGSDGKIKGVERRAYRILRPEGRVYAKAEAFVGGDTKVGSMRAWCIPAQGKDFEVKDKDAAVDRSLGIENGILVSDFKVRTLQIPAGDPGNVVGYEIQYDSRPFVLEDGWDFQREIPVKEARYTLQMPSGWEYKAVWMNHPKMEPTTLGGNQWQWVVTDVPEVRWERNMPPFEGVVGRMVVAFLGPGAKWTNGFVSWDDMGKWQNGLVAGRRDPTSEISRKVAEINERRAAPQQKMRGIADFMQKDIRYVGIELGIGGWQPHTAGEVFTHRYGDCKDKATLMSSMLKLSGIDSYYLIINTERGAVTSATPPTKMFNHAILAIRLPDQLDDPEFQAIYNDPKLGRLLIFDPTDEKTSIGSLRGELQANYALLITPEGGQLIETPQLPSSYNGMQRAGKLTLDPQGTLRGHIEETLKGDFATYERYYQSGVPSSKDRVKRIEQEVSHSIGMFQITSASITNLDQNTLPFGYSYEFVAPSYAKPVGSLLAVRPAVMGRESSDLLETKEPRKFPVNFEGPRHDVDQFEITIPQGYVVDDLPPPVDLDYNFASYHSKIETAGNVLKYTRTLEIKELTVPLSQMEDLKKFYRVIAGDERNTAVLKPEAH